MSALPVAGVRIDRESRAYPALPAAWCLLLEGLKQTSNSHAFTSDDCQTGARPPNSRDLSVTRLPLCRQGPQSPGAAAAAGWLSVTGATRESEGMSLSICAGWSGRRCHALMPEGRRAVL